MIQTIDNVFIVYTIPVVGSHSERKAPMGSCNFFLFLKNK